MAFINIVFVCLRIYNDYVFVLLCCLLCAYEKLVFIFLNSLLSKKINGHWPHSRTCMMTRQSDRIERKSEIVTAEISHAKQMRYA